MKKYINNRLLMVATVSSILLSGCASNTIVVSPNENNAHQNVKRISKGEIKDCVDCYATVFKKKNEKVPIGKSSKNLDKSESLYAVNNKQNPYLVKKDYYEEDREGNNIYFALKNSTSNNINKSFLKKKRIQVGAFRNYAGAKVYAKRYSLLTNKYNIDIKENVKNNKPIYRVQIEGFSTESEAQHFMAQYGLNGAFLVRR